QEAMDALAARGGCAATAAAATAQFEQELAPIREQEAKAVKAQGQSRGEALAEEIRDLLLQAAYVELIKAEADGMFAADGGAGFSFETVRRLRRHKFPFDRSHDTLDAACAALVARLYQFGLTKPFGTVNDDGVIWMPDTVRLARMIQPNRETQHQ